MCLACNVADVLVMLDASGSIGVRRQNWEQMKNFTIAIINSFPVSEDGVRMSLIRFSTDTSVIFQLDDYYTRNEMVRQVEDLDIVGDETNIAGSLNIARTDIFEKRNGDRADARNIIILITDGRETVYENGDVIRAQEELKIEDLVEVFTVGITEEVDNDQLEHIASDPDATHAFSVESFDDLMSVLEDVVGQACPGDGQGSEPTPTPPTGIIMCRCTRITH